jgi:very-short-patch-repair endonuclease
MAKSIERARSLRKTMSPPELALWLQLRALRAEGWHFRRQAPEGPYFLDFVCRRAMLILEVDGGQHGSDDQIEHDRERDAYLERKGFRVLRFWSNNVMDSIDTVMTIVRDTLGARTGVTSEGVQPNPHQGARYRRLVRLGLRRK